MGGTVCAFRARRRLTASFRTCRQEFATFEESLPQPMENGCQSHMTTHRGSTYSQAEGCDVSQGGDGSLTGREPFGMAIPWIGSKRVSGDKNMLASRLPLPCACKNYSTPNTDGSMTNPCAGTL